MTARIWSLEAILGSSYPGLHAHSADVNGGLGKRSSVTPRPARGESADQMDVDDDPSTAPLGDVSSDTAHSSHSTNTVCRHVLSGHKKDIFAVAWAPAESTSSDSSKLLATASFDNTARIWNADDGSCLRVFEEHTDSVYSVCFSADRRFLVTGGMDHRLFVSSVETGDVVLAHAGAGGVFDVAWHTSKPRKALKDASIKDEDSNQQHANADHNPDTVKYRQQLALAQADKSLVVLDVSDL